MNKFICLILVFSLAGCAVCKSSDSPEVCRTSNVTIHNLILECLREKASVESVHICCE